MPLSLEQEAELLPLTEKASDLIANLIMEEDSNSDNEFQKTIEQISAISPIMSTIYLGLYKRIPHIKSRLLDYVRNNI
jgi:hypothetical protein